MTEGELRAQAKVLVALLLTCQSLLSFHAEGEGPVRFGFPLPAEALTKGLRLAGSRGASLQWSYLQDQVDAASARQWVELVVAGAHGRVTISVGGIGPSEVGAGEVCKFEQSHVRKEGYTETTGRWRWSDGSVDRQVRSVFTRSWISETGEAFAAGEALREVDSNLLQRCLRVRIKGKSWAKASIMPKPGKLGYSVRQQILAVVKSLPTAPGDRGRGDYVRKGGAVNNLEFDTTLALARLGLWSGEAEILQRALEAAWHLVDRDLDQQTGLPFRHGPDHREVRPETGHVWLQGLLLVGCIFADRELIAAARSIGSSLGQALAKRFPGQGYADRMRDEAWPLLELECLLAFGETPKLVDAADRLAKRILLRWDPVDGVLRYGEGESRGEAYKERAWLTGGIMLPALRAHLARAGDARIGAVIAVLEERLLKLVRSTAEGLPVQYWVRRGEVFGVFGLAAGAESVMLLEGLPAKALRSTLRRGTLRRALDGMFAADDPDLATSFTKVARCAWVYR